MRVRELMEVDVLTLDADDHLDLAADLMRLARVRHMPVLGQGAVVGIVSQRDLFRAGVSSVLQLARTAEREWLARIPVAHVMTAPVFSVGPHDSVRNAVSVMLAKRIGCLPVVDGGRLVGILSESDCLRYLARLLEIADARSELPELPKAT